MREGKRRTHLVDVAIVAMLFLAAYFAVFGGEYTIFRIKGLESVEAGSESDLATTEAAIDSLRAVAAELESDPAAIERVARERYGMIRDGEILYRFREEATADTAARSKPRE